MGIIVSVCPTAEFISADAEHISADAEHVSVDAEHVCLSVGTVLASAMHAFGYLVINEESHSDTVMMSEWLSSLLYDKMY